MTPLHALTAIWILYALAFVTMRASAHRSQSPSAQVDRSAARGLVIELVAVALCWLPLGRPTPSAAWPAVLLAAVALGFSAWAVYELAEQLRVMAAIGREHRLVTSGPYAIVRNPIYLGLLLLMIATGLIRQSWPATILLAAAFIAGTQIRVRAEEALLRAYFGERWAQYAARVPAYLPFVK